MTVEGFAEGVVVYGSPGGSECQMFLSLCIPDSKGLKQMNWKDGNFIFQHLILS